MSRAQKSIIDELDRALSAAPADTFIRRSDTSLVLIGSVARSRQLKYSDIDVLLLSARLVSKTPHLRNFEFHVFTPDKFVSLGLAGDDFPNWCARFGVPVWGKVAWSGVLNKLQVAPWPDWHRKIETARKRLVSAELFARSRDYEAAREELLFGYDHLSRGLLLQAKYFPYSRPELPEQMRNIDRSIGAGLRELELRRVTVPKLKRLISALKSHIRNIAPDQAEIADARVKELMSPLI